MTRRSWLPFTAGIAIGFPLILLGSVLATRRGPETSSPEATAAATVAGRR